MNKQHIVMVAVALLAAAAIVAVVLVYMATQRQAAVSENAPDRQTESQVASEDETLLELEDGLEVYFAQNGSDGVYPRERYTEREDDYVFAMEELVTGPTAEESAEGYVTHVRFDESETSVCEDRNFSIVAEGGTFVLWFCRPLYNQDDESAMNLAEQQVRRTLEKLDLIDDVVLLNQERECFNDTVGDDSCLEQLPAGVTQ